MGGPGYVRINEWVQKRLAIRGVQDGLGTCFELASTRDGLSEDRKAELTLAWVSPNYRNAFWNLPPSLIRNRRRHA